MIINEYAIDYLQRAADERLTVELEHIRVARERQADEQPRARTSFTAWFATGPRRRSTSSPAHRHAH